jgi:hypothetical protein
MQALMRSVELLGKGGGECLGVIKPMESRVIAMTVGVFRCPRSGGEIDVTRL